MHLRLSLVAANTFALTFMAAYCIDLVVFELFLIVTRIMVFPQIVEMIREKDSPVCYHLLYFMLKVETSGARNGFFEHKHK